MDAPLLKIENLRTYFYSRAKRAFIRSVDNVSLSLARGETLGVVGESGSGKSVTALSVMGLIAAGPGVVSGKIGFSSNGLKKNLLQDLGDYVQVEEEDGRISAVRKDDSGWQRHVERLMSSIRGRYISMIFQNPKSALNPYIPVGRQIAEAVRLHTDVQEPKAARERALHWLERVRIDSPRLRYDNFPYGLSGGMCQRAMIAMALSSEPKLLIADEPTTGLDATIQSRIVDLLEELKAELGIATLLISHDISVIRRLADRVTVMYGGTVVESGPAGKVLVADSSARHPYTAALLASIPTTAHIQSRAPLPAIEGEVLDTINVPRGCRFYARCNRVNDAVQSACQEQEPPLVEIEAGHAVRCWLFASRVIP